MSRPTYKDLIGPSPWADPRWPKFPAREDVRVDEWADRYRKLSGKFASEPGPWRTDRTPYTREVMNAFIDPRVERITIMASVQSSKTESVYNMVAYAIDQDPGPVLIAMPTLMTLRRVNHRVRAMIEGSPRLAAHLTGDPDDITLKEIILDRMSIYFVTAGSAADLSNVQARYVILDEVDDYPLTTGETGSPIEMAESRATTFWDKKIVTLCTPTVEGSYIHTEHQRSDRRKYWVPCPHCDGYQVLNFRQVKHEWETLGEWPKEKRDPDYIRKARVARYECEHCGEDIDDRHKSKMLRDGKWIPESYPSEVNRSTPPVPARSHIGFWWNAMYSPWRTFSEVAAHFFETKDDREKFQSFVNLSLAEPWKEIVQEVKSSELLELRTEREPTIVPAGALALTAGIDTQKYGFWVVIRAWFRDMSSHLIRHGFVRTWEELESWIFHDIYPVEGSEGSDEEGPALVYPVWRAAIDTAGTEGDPGKATMTEQVYNWLRRRGGSIVFGVKGLSRTLAGGKKMQFSLIDKMPGRRGKWIPGGIRLWHINTGLIKDAIWSRIETDKFHLHAKVGEKYASHITSEVKERDRRGRYRWTVQAKRANHLLDAEVYAAAMADPECWGGVLVLPDIDIPVEKLRPDSRPAPASRQLEGHQDQYREMLQRAQQRGR